MERLGTVAIVGVGLIGGSIGLALRSGASPGGSSGWAGTRGRWSRPRRGAIDEATTDLASGVAEAEVVVVCTPVSRIAQDVRRAAEAAPAEALVTDAGSTKRQIVEAVERHPAAAALFVGAHPIAGSERIGLGARPGRPVRGPVCVLTPTPRTPARPARAGESVLERRWAAGCSRLTPDRARRGPGLHEPPAPRPGRGRSAVVLPPEWLALAAGAFRDGTRVAGADTGLWTAIFRDNRGPLLKPSAPSRTGRRVQVCRHDRRRGRHPPVVGRGAGSAESLFDTHAAHRRTRKSADPYAPSLLPCRDRILDAAPLVTVPPSLTRPGRCMLWHLEIRPAPGHPDLAGQRLAVEAAEAGSPGPWTIAASRGFLVEGRLASDDLHRAAATGAGRSGRRDVPVRPRDASAGCRRDASSTSCPSPA